MQKVFCDRCKKELTNQAHYSIGEIEKCLPVRNPKRWIQLKQGKVSVVGKEEPWFAYLDLHFCEACFKKPFVPADFLKLSGRQ